jgi:hypothetical protein
MKQIINFNVIHNAKLVRFQVLTAASMKTTAVWDTAPCSLVEADRRFRGAYWLHHDPDDAVRTSVTAFYFYET